MTYPPGIILRPVTIGGATILESGEQLSLVAEIKSSRGLMWAATGWQFHAVPRTITGSGGEELTFSLPVTDLTGWRLLDNPGSAIDVSAPGSYTHMYTIKLTTLQGGRAVAVRTVGPFVLPTEDLSPVDLDLMLPVGTAAGGVALVPDSWSARLDALEQGGGVDGGTGTGTGSGVEEVSGVVALESTGPRLRQFYTLAEATIGGETYPEDTAVVCRRLASGTWECMDVPFNGTPAPEVPVDDTTAPTIPTGLAVSAVTATGCTLTWTASTDAGGVNYYLVTKDGGATTHLVTAGAAYETEWTFTDLTPATAYTLGVKAVDLSGNESAYATIGTTTAAGPSNAAPTAPTSLAATMTSTTAALTWTAATDDVGVVAYRVSSDNGATWITSSVTATSYTVTGLTQGTSYTFAVQAGDVAGLWGPSATLTVSTASVLAEVAKYRYAFPEGTGTTSAEASGTHPDAYMRFDYVTNWKPGWNGAGYGIQNGALKALLQPYPGMTLTATTGCAISLHAARSGYLVPESGTAIGGLEGYDVVGPSEQPVLRLFVIDNVIRATVWLTDGTTYTVDGALPSGLTVVGEWHHYGATWEAATKTLHVYRDGAQVAEGTYGGAATIRATVNSSHFAAGLKDATGTSRSGDGLTRDNIRLFDTYQTAAQMAAWATQAVV